MFIARQLIDPLQELGRFFPILSLTGPRQAGKTTLLQQVFPSYRYVSFEDPEYRRRFEEDPRGFLRQYDQFAIFDEAQRVPDLFSYLQGLVDAQRTPARFILSGSQNFLLMRGITQSLAGRVGITRLFPLDFREVQDADLLPQDPWRAVHGGFYPVHYQMDMPPRFFYPNYLATYLERDLAEVVKPSNQTTFRRFLQFCSTLVGQLVNYALLAKSIGISVATVKNWLSLLERSYIIFLLPPYFANMGKRLVKSPKLYFYDVGLAAYLLDLDAPEAVQQSRYAGSLFENMIISDRVKQRQHQGKDLRFSFFRDNNGLEVDLLETNAQSIHLTEIKSSSTYQPKMSINLRKLARSIAEVDQMEVVYAGSDSFESDGVHICSWKDCW